MALVLAGVPAIGQGPRTDRRLTQAVERNDVAAVRRLVRAGVSPEAASPDGSTPLLVATLHSGHDVARALLAAGARPGAANRYGVFPLLHASRVGDVQMIELLLAGGADPGQAHPDGETPLMAVARAGRVDGVRLLLARGVDVNAAEGTQRQTALMWAAAEGHADVVSALLEAGANPNATAEATGLAARRHADHPTGGLTALMFAAREGHTDAVRRLVDGGADMSIANPDGATALVIAILNDRLDLAGLLIEKGADVNDGSLYQAVAAHNLTRDVLMNDPTRPRLDHDNRLTAMDLIRMLVAKGADPNKVVRQQFHVLGNCCAPTQQGSALYQAAERADVEVLKVFLAAGAAPEPPMVDAGRPEAPAGPQQGGADGITPLIAALTGGPGGRGGGPGDNAGAERAYREASNRSPVDATRALLEAGADPNRAKLNGETAMHVAAQAGNVTLLQLLVDHGAKPDAKAGRDGLTPLDYATGKAPQPAGRLGGPPPGPSRPRPEAAAFLRKLMGLPDEPATAAPPAATDADRPSAND